jgi:putative DNA primase/helicase
MSDKKIFNLLDEDDITELRSARPASNVLRLAPDPEILRPFGDGVTGEISSFVRKAVQKKPKKKHEPLVLPDGLPVIHIRNGELSSLATQAEGALIKADAPFYQRTGKLVRPITEDVDASHGRKTTVVRIKPLDSVYARDFLNRNAAFVKKDLRTNHDMLVNPPDEVVATMLAREGEWKFRSIAGVITTPTMRPDGSLLLDAGYDKATRLLLISPPQIPTIPERPTNEDAEGALKFLEELLIGFPFVDDVARAVALSAIITPVVRGAFPVTVLHASRAPTAGTGKSYLFDTVSAIATGQLMPVISAGCNEAETEKRLAAAMMTGQPLISVDNIDGELSGAALCQMIERPIVDLRILGKSELIRIEARGTSLFATGNNFTIVGDVCRRTITANLDAKLERPELRQFGSDPVGSVLANRGKYIAAALTICRAYFAAGRPVVAPKFASFEGWSDTVRSSLIWLGKGDAVKSMENSRAEDPERIELSDMLEAWSATIGTGSESRRRLADVLSKGLDMTRDHAGAELAPTYPEFNAALMAMAQRSTGKRTEQPEARMFGKWLQRFKGRILNGKRFMCVPNEKRGNEWWVEQV